MEKNTQSATRIIWRVESEEKAKKEHPDWNKKQVNAFIDAIEALLDKEGFFN